MAARAGMNPKPGWNQVFFPVPVLGHGAAQCLWSSSHRDGHTARAGCGAMGVIQELCTKRALPWGFQLSQLCCQGSGCGAMGVLQELCTKRALPLGVSVVTAPVTSAERWHSMSTEALPQNTCQAVATAPKSCVFCTDTCVISHE